MITEEKLGKMTTKENVAVNRDQPIKMNIVAMVMHDLCGLQTGRIKTRAPHFWNFL